MDEDDNSFNFLEMLKENTIECLQMVGFKEDNKKIDKPLLVKDKLQCISCGKVSKSSAKFCSDCGTFLECV